ncbi:MAG TPA: tetratricopeptide repeat protein, partial [Thermoanaerobaculia bacterium]|nr:tetratricopeptide repeat protein [Thermoanaerobaculia bacterium]
MTGVSPFRGDSAAETLHRICTWEPAPARSLNPAVPEDLSEFIVRLLEKDLRRRPGSAADALAHLDEILPALPGEAPTLVDRPGLARLPAVDTPTVLPVVRLRDRLRRLGRRPKTIAVVLAALGALALGAVVTLWLRQPPKTLYVAVPETVTSAGPGNVSEELDLAANAVHTSLLQGLLGFQHVAALEPSRDDAPAANHPTALARALAADEVLTSRLQCGARNCRLDLRRLRGSDGRLLWAQGFTVDPGSLLEVGLAVIEHLRDAYPDARLRPGVPDLQVRARDYEAYLRLKRRFGGREQGFSTDDLLIGLERLERTSPRFLDLPLDTATALVKRFEVTRDRADLERAAEEVERARAIAPQDPRVLVQEAKVGRVAGRLEDAEAALERLRRLEPGNVQGLQQQALLLEHQGRRPEALALLREAVRQLPSAGFHFNLGSMLYRQGDVAGARRELEAGLALGPRYYDGLSYLAQLELASGDPKRAAKLYEELVRRSPEYTELTNLGTAYLLAGRWADAARRFREALKLSPGSPSALLNLADAELLAGRRQEASAL